MPNQEVAGGAGTASASIEQVHEMFCRYVREGDLEAALTLYDPEVSFCTRAGEIRHGRDAMREELRPLAEAHAEFAFQVRRKIESGDTALVHNEWTMNGQEGYAVEVFRRDPDAGWRFLIGDPFTIGSRRG